LNAMNDLADLYRRQGKYALAEPLFLQALERQRRLYGGEHPDTLALMDGLAILYRLEGKYAEAEPLNTKASRSNAAPRARTPNTLSSMTLWRLVQEEGKYSEAEPC